MILSHVGRDLQLFNLLPPHIADYLLLDSDLIANVHESLMDEMLTSIIEGTRPTSGRQKRSPGGTKPTGAGYALPYWRGSRFMATLSLKRNRWLLLNTSYFAIH